MQKLSNVKVTKKVLKCNVADLSHQSQHSIVQLSFAVVHILQSCIQKLFAVIVQKKSFLLQWCNLMLSYAIVPAEKILNKGVDDIFQLQWSI